MSNPVSQESRILVGLIQDKVQLIFLQKCHDLLTGLADQRTNKEIGAHGWYARESQRATAPEQIHEDQFGVVGSMVPQSDFIITDFLSNPAEKVISHLPGQCFQGSFLTMMTSPEVFFFSMVAQPFFLAQG